MSQCSRWRVDVSISFLEPDESRELITRPVADFPANFYGEAAVERIIQITNGHPRNIQLVCGLLLERMNEIRRTSSNAKVEAADVDAVLALARSGIAWTQASFAAWLK